MEQAGRKMAKSGVKVGLVTADIAGKVAKKVAMNVAEVAESFVDLVEGTISDRVEVTDADVEQTSPPSPKTSRITEVTVEKGKIVRAPSLTPNLTYIES
jgi:hypothetical protein